MKAQSISTSPKSYAVRREADRQAECRLAFVVLTSMLLAGGFLLSAWQHFAALECQYQRQKLRGERSQLQFKFEQLKAERERVGTLDRLAQEARAIGLQGIQPQQIIAQP